MDVLNLEFELRAFHVLDVDVKEVGGELMGEGLAMGPVVPTSEPPGDRPYDVTLT